jgi:hypothetical protein
LQAPGLQPRHGQNSQSRSLKEASTPQEHALSRPARIMQPSPHLQEKKKNTLRKLALISTFSPKDNLNGKMQNGLHTDVGLLLLRLDDRREGFHSFTFLHPNSVSRHSRTQQRQLVGFLRKVEFRCDLKLGPLQTSAIHFGKQQMTLHGTREKLHDLNELWKLRQRGMQGGRFTYLAHANAGKGRDGEFLIQAE